MKENVKYFILFTSYLLCSLVYLALSTYGDFWSCFYFIKDNLFICVAAILVRPKMKLKIAIDFVVLTKVYSTISMIAMLFFNFKLFNDYSFIFLSIFSIPLIAYEWQQLLNKDN